MTELAITTIGPASSVQDGGRYGAQRYGLTPSGAMDVLALATANALVGNDVMAATIEIGPFAASVTAKGGAVHLGRLQAQRGLPTSAAAHCRCRNP